MFFFLSEKSVKNLVRRLNGGNREDQLKKLTFVSEIAGIAHHSETISSSREANVIFCKVDLTNQKIEFHLFDSNIPQYLIPAAFSKAFSQLRTPRNCLVSEQLEQWLAECQKYGGKDLVTMVCGNKVDGQVPGWNGLMRVLCCLYLLNVFDIPR